MAMTTRFGGGFLSGECNFELLWRIVGSRVRGEVRVLGAGHEGRVWKVSYLEGMGFGYLFILASMVFSWWFLAVESFLSQNHESDPSWDGGLGKVRIGFNWGISFLVGEAWTGLVPGPLVTPGINRFCRVSLAVLVC